MTQPMATADQLNAGLQVTRSVKGHHITITPAAVGGGHTVDVLTGGERIPGWASTHRTTAAAIDAANQIREMVLACGKLYSRETKTPTETTPTKPVAPQGIPMPSPGRNANHWLTLGDNLLEVLATGEPGDIIRRGRTRDGKWTITQMLAAHNRGFAVAHGPDGRDWTKITHVVLTEAGCAQARKLAAMRTAAQDRAAQIAPRPPVAKAPVAGIAESAVGAPAFKEECNEEFSVPGGLREPDRTRGSDPAQRPSGEPSGLHQNPAAQGKIPTDRGNRAGSQGRSGAPRLGRLRPPVRRRGTGQIPARRVRDAVSLGVRGELPSTQRALRNLLGHQRNGRNQAGMEVHPRARSPGRRGRLAPLVSMNR
jgi:hypothetical protein